MNLDELSITPKIDGCTLFYLAQPYTYKMRIFPVQRLVRFLQ